MADQRLPKKPIYKMFLDGRDTRKIIEWLKKLDDGDGEIDFNDPQLQAALMKLSDRITNIETFITQLPNMSALITRLTNVESIGSENKTSIETINNDLLMAKARITNLENQLTGVDLMNIVTCISDIEQALSEINPYGDMTPITNEEIAEILS